MRVNPNGNIEAFEPVVREIEQFQHLFSHITWMGYKYDYDVNVKNMRNLDSSKTKMICLSRSGGKSFAAKMGILVNMVRVFPRVLKAILSHDVMHTRAPSMPAFLAIIVSYFYRKKVYWHKYAGSWSESNVPPFYKLQRTILKFLTHTHVTINGKWENQPSHVLTFENPCLTKSEITDITTKSKPVDFSNTLNFCFIGNLTYSKGVDDLIEALHNLQEKDRLGSVHFIGSSKKLDVYKTKAKGLPVCFHGFMLRAEMVAVLQKCHFLILPSHSEGFPKVVAEVSPYGIIPIVSSISSIPQYVIHGKNGFLTEAGSVSSIVEVLEIVLKMEINALQQMSHRFREMKERFTYEYYNERIEKEILR